MSRLNDCDPFFLLLRHVVLRRFLRCELQEEERSFVQDNICKHRTALWINVFAAACIVWGLLKVAPENTVILITALVGPVMVFGGAWFAITFGGVPARLIEVAMSTTFWMFTAFLVSLTTMFVVVGFVSPPQIWPVLAIVFWAGYMSCVQYDTADGLKAGLDEAVLKHSRAALRFYKEKHQITDEEGQ